jgi:hypothetical protein
MVKGHLNPWISLLYCVGIMTDAGKKLSETLAAVGTPQFQAQAVDFNNKLTAVQQVLQVDIGEISQRLKVLEQLLSTEKAKPRKVKKVDEPAGAPPAATGETAPAGTPPAAAVSAGPITGNSAYTVFTKRYREDAEFRASFLTPEWIAEMDTVENIAKKKTPEQKLTPQAQWIWNKLKTTQDPRHARMEAEFKAAKAPKKDAAAPTQQKEEASPQPEKK